MPRSALPAHAAPRTRISIDALRANLAVALAASSNGLVDGQADAWGHGVVTLTRAALDAGASGVVVDTAGAAALAVGAGGRAGSVATGEGGLPASSWVRASHGARADDDASAMVYGLTPGMPAVMSLHGHVLSLKPLLAGEGVSYGFTHHASRDTVVALVAGGYAQGIVRSLGNAAHVLIGDRRCPIVGRVAMDVCVVDIGDASVSRGDDVIFFGSGSGRGSSSDASVALAQPPTVHEWARLTGLTAAELVTAVGLRTRREVAA